MSRPKNEAFEKPPALATRSSSREHYVAPEFRSSSRPSSTSSTSAAGAAASVTDSADLHDVFDDPTGDVTATTAAGTTLSTAGASITTTATPIVTSAAATFQTPSQTLTASHPATTSSVPTTSTTMADAQVSGPSAPAQPPATSSATGAVGAPAAQAINRSQENSFAPPVFHGAAHEDAEVWLSRFEKYIVYRGFNDRDKVNFLAVVLRDDAADWYDSLPDTSTDTWAHLKQAFEQRFKETDLLKWQKASTMWSRSQGEMESVDAYVTAMKKLARSVAVDDVQLRFAIQRGLRPELIGHVIQSQPESIDALIKSARIAEAAASATAAAKPETSLDKVIMALSANREAAERNTEEMKRLAGQLATGQSINAVDNEPTAAGPRSTTGRRGGAISNGQQRGQRWRPRGQRQQQWPAPQLTEAQRSQQNPGTEMPSSPCSDCGGMHAFGKQFCRARDIDCFLCGRRGHLKRMCRSGRRPMANFQGNIGPPNFSA